MKTEFFDIALMSKKFILLFWIYLLQIHVLMRQVLNFWLYWLYFLDYIKSIIIFKVVTSKESFFLQILAKSKNNETFSWCPIVVYELHKPPEIRKFTILFSSVDSSNVYEVIFNVIGFG